jgi:hypothetical protein
LKKAISFLAIICLPLMANAQHEHAAGMQMMQGFYGAYPQTREASGTAWQPESSPMEGLHFMSHDWNVMAHGYVFGIYDHQGGKRGKDKTFSSSMFMLMVDRKTSVGTFGFRNMLSLDPLMGKRGYPLLFQTGETYDGIHPLIDRQHPHDFFMEEAFTYSLPLSEKNSLFVYMGLPGEPALGPPAFMHRFSAMDNPEAPLGHHWLDSTHISYGVITLGCVFGAFKFDSSVFRGREPDQHRWGIESPGLDSYSGRVTFNPGKDLSFQASYGYLDSPEQLEPSVDVARITVSAMYNRSFKYGNWQTTFAWGRNDKKPGLATNAFLLESTVNFIKEHTVFTRFEYVQKDELFEEGDPLAGKKYGIKKFSLGYIYDFPEWNHVQLGVGSSYSMHFISRTLEGPYSRTPKSYLVFVRLKL